MDILLLVGAALAVMAASAPKKVAPPKSAGLDPIAVVGSVGSAMKEGTGLAHALDGFLGDVRNLVTNGASAANGSTSGTTDTMNNTGGSGDYHAPTDDGSYGPQQE